MIDSRKVIAELAAAQEELYEINRLLCRVSTQHRRLSFRVAQLKRQLNKDIKEQLNLK